MDMIAKINRYSEAGQLWEHTGTVVGPHPNSCGNTPGQVWGTHQEQVWSRSSHIYVCSDQGFLLYRNLRSDSRSLIQETLLNTKTKKEDTF